MGLMRLPDGLLEIVCRQVGVEYFPALKPVCRRLNAACAAVEAAQFTLANRAHSIYNLACNGHLDLLREHPAVREGLNPMHIFHAACEKGHVAILAWIQVDDINMEQFMYGVRLAAHAGHVEIVRFLRAVVPESWSRADVSFKQAVLQGAVTGGHMPLFLTYAPDGHYKCTDSDFAKMNDDFFSMFLDNGTVSSIPQVWTAFHAAVHGGHLTRAKWLNDYLNGLMPLPVAPATLAPLACSSGSLEMTDWVFNTLGVVPSAQDILRFLPDAAATGNVDIVKLLRAQLPDDVGSDLEGAFIQAARFNHVDVMRLLMPQSADCYNQALLLATDDRCLSAMNLCLSQAGITADTLSRAFISASVDSCTYAMSLLHTASVQREEIHLPGLSRACYLEAFRKYRLNSVRFLVKVARPRTINQAFLEACTFGIRADPRRDTPCRPRVLRVLARYATNHARAIWMSLQKTVVRDACRNLE